ncbi:mannose 6-phosphate receptor domain-containing protein [Lindgomyces ingoldianus]|uniref:Mannose 6-phosphate receptor domain-containing protein n=1 Tax=Lindgomyces ingoldianus TaxID=673940 RepID=A0ACB6QWL1_9PLEO|nr:mannose 6-phosphate receptor domain-containing protein [Lindgomyces ingoldianus]KAF2471414.1 mannose 6-phosphate receptor domain-containing protein [Lindgomyces ingoldianus]
MKLTFWSALVFLLSTADFSAAASSSKDKKPLKPCTARSPTTDRFFDLNPLHRTGAEKGKKSKEEEEGSWHAKGYDYGANFTINFCGAVVEELDNVKELDKDMWKNVSAFYKKGDRQYAIGLENSEPVFRGRKLVLNYTGGSLCPSTKSRRHIQGPASLPPREIVDDDPNDDDKHKEHKGDKRRKSTVISLLCESDPLAKTSVSFVAAVEDCVYFFEGRSPYACGKVEAESQALGPGGVFGVIVLIAILVYLVGGCVYQRTVMHQRGWRQLPNYQMWASIGRFIVDMFIILTSSCARFLPSRRGYSRVSLGADNGRRGRRNDDENRLIDNLDEEWDD